MTKPEKISSKEMEYEFWKTADGFVLSVFIFQGVAGDSVISIRVPDGEALELRLNPELLRMKVSAVGQNPGLFEDDRVDFISPT